MTASLELTLDAPAHRLLKAATHWASTEENRVSVTSVAFTPAGVVATDSYKLIRLPWNYLVGLDGDKFPGDRPWLFPAEKLRWALGRYNTRDKVTLTVTSDEAVVARRGQRVTLSAVEGKYPDIEELFARATTGGWDAEPSAFNVEHLKAVNGLSNALQRVCPLVSRGEKSALVVDPNSDTPIAMVMPMRLRGPARDLFGVREQEVAA